MSGVKARRSGLTSSITSIIFVVAILVVINLIAVRHASQYDVTSNKRFTLSPQTIQILENLNEPVHAYSFYRELDEDYEKIQDYLRLFQHASKRFSYQNVDADKNPSLATKFDVASYNTVVLQQGESFRKVTEATEQALTNTLIRLIQGDSFRKVCFTTENGEYELDSMDSDGLFMLKMALQNANYHVEPINLMAMDNDLEECDILAIVGPAHDPVDSVIDKIKRFLNTGGCLFIALDPGAHGKFADQLTDYGIAVGENVIIDPKGFQNILQPIVDNYPPHDITKGFNSGLVFRIASSIAMVEPANEEWSVRHLAMTSDQAYAKTDLNSLSNETIEFDPEKDISGPFSIAVTAERVDFSTPSEISDIPRTRIVAVGDADFISNAFLQTLAAHQPFILNIFHWLSDEKDLIAIPPREIISQPLMLQNSQLMTAFFIPIVLIPLVVAIFGIVRIVVRRRRA